jgi:hypothetical protein
MIRVRSAYLAVLAAVALVSVTVCPTFAEDPDHGTAEVACGTVKKGFYTVSHRGAAKAVTVEIVADPGCRAVVLQNGILNTRDTVPPMATACGSTNTSATVTCLGVRNLSIACEGGGAGSCSARITQIDDPAPSSSNL